MSRVSNPGFTEPENPGYLGFIQTRKPGFWMPVNPGFSGLNFALHCVIKRPYQPRVCNMSMIPCLFSLAVALICECARLASVCRSEPDVCRLVTDASVDVEKSQLASIRSEMATFESSDKRGRGLELVLAKYPAVISRRRKNVFRRWRLMHESGIATE